MIDIGEINQEKYEKLYSLQINTNTIYDFVLRRKLLKRIFKKIGFVPSNKDVLDIGFGFAYLFTLFKQTNKITGVELSSKAIEMAQRKLEKKGYKKINLIRHDLNKGLKLKGKYDIIICSHVLEHIKNAKKLLQDIKKITATNGLLIILLPLNELYQQNFHERKFNKKILKMLSFKTLFEEDASESIAFVEWIDSNKLRNPVYYFIARTIHIILSLLPLQIILIVERIMKKTGSKPKQKVLILKREEY